jgi:hypothetical protein
MLEALGGGLQMFLEHHKQRNNVWGFDLLWLLKCSLIGLPTLHFQTLRKFCFSFVFSQWWMDGCVHLSSIYDKETKVQTSVGWLFDLLKFSKLF